MPDTDSNSKKAGDHAVSGVEIVLDDVVKQYSGSQAPAVDHFSLTIPAGEVVVFVGPSGCGKTTTMRMINRLIEPTSGRITIGGKDALSLNADELRRGIGYSIQAAGLFPHMTIAQNVGMVPSLIGWDKKRIKARTEEMLDVVGLEPSTYLDRYPRQLSGGQQQRVAIARSLVNNPSILMCDEPTGNLDTGTSKEVIQLFREMNEASGITVILVTHDQDVARSARRIIALRDGEVVEDTADFARAMQALHPIEPDEAADPG